MTSNTRVQRLIEEFEDGATSGLGWNSYSIRHGIAAVLRHLADIEAQYGDIESFYAVPVRTLEDLADALEAPSLLERALKGDAAAAKQFLHEAGFTDKQGQWLPQYQPIADDALAEPEPEKPTPSDEELMALAVTVFEDPFATDVHYARAVLARWGTCGFGRHIRIHYEPIDD